MAERAIDRIRFAPRALRAEYAAAYLSISVSTFRALVAKRDLPQPKRIGNVPVWDREDLDDVMDRQGKTTLNEWD